MRTQTGVAQEYVRFLETLERAEDVFTPDVFVDVNVPGWRFQIRGAEAIRKQFAEDYVTSTVLSTRTTPTPDGFVAEIEQEWSPHGVRQYCRFVTIATVTGDRMSEVTIYCTGVWQPQTVERQAREAPMIR